MYQKTDLPFQEMLKKVREGKIDFQDIWALNQGLATLVAIDTIIVVQKNKTCHFINRSQIKNFAHAKNLDIIIFLAEHYQAKKNGGNLIKHKLLFKAQDGKGNCTGPGLFFYCKRMPAYLSTN